MDYTRFVDIAREVTPPAGGITSRTLFNNEGLKVVLFGFDAGQELSEHTSSVPAVMHFIDGQADVTLGEDPSEAGPGTWVHMPAGLKHSITAKTPVTMLLMMLKHGSRA